MRDTRFVDHIDLTGLDFQTWLDRLSDLDSDDLFVDYLGPNHAAVLLEQGDTLVVTFEKYADIANAAHQARPMAWHIAQTHGWSALTVICDSFDYFRTPHVYHYFDRLVDDGILDGYARVVVLGIGDTSHAAAVFSVVAPCAEVVLFGPIATLDRDTTPWDTGHAAARRLDFSSRYAYGPTLVETAAQVYVFFDRTQPIETMHAGLFEGENIHHIGLRLYGTPWHGLVDVTSLGDILLAMTAPRPVQTMRQVLRQRRRKPHYLRTLLFITQGKDRPDLIRRVCTHTLSIFENAPRFVQALAQLSDPGGK